MAQNLLFIDTKIPYNMKQLITLALVALMGVAMAQQTYLDQNKNKHLIGQFKATALQEDTSYNKWYNKNFEAYKIDQSLAPKIKSLANDKIKIQIFLGTWCGDSKREVPRMIKLLEQTGITNYEIIGTYDTDTLYKVSPQHEEKGLNIFRVPTFIVYKDGKELNRIIEFPKESFEKDLITILQNKPYTPHYNLGNTIDTYFSEKNYSDSIIEKVAKLVKGKSYTFSELNAKAYVELRKNNTDYAVALFRVNARLYPGLDAYDSLAEAYTKKKDDKNAIALWQYIAEDANNKNKKALEQLRKLTMK
jgi:thiol-disulfide isomerase/thioredoxin